MFYTTAVMVAGFLRVQCVYHELSKLEFKAPATVLKDALFGYSIAYQPTVKHLVISAPHGNRVGQVFECNIETQNCTDIIVENIETESEALTDMWLGATVAAGNDFTVMCAPKFTRKNDAFTYSNQYRKRGTFGRCYMSPASGGNVTAMVSLSLSDKGKLNPYELYFDSFGWSSHVDKHDSILIGGPAMHTGRAILYPNVMAAPKLLSHTGNRKISYNLGYSVTSGLFISTNESDIYYAISSPYGTFGAGQIFITNTKKNMDLDNPLDGKRSYDFKLPVGSLYGASMCSAKLRGPGQREALLVGAPLFVQGVQVDVGAVFVYQFDNSKNKVVHQQTILGTANGGRFGSAVISLGDLNGDKKHEVAVSAPYENSGRGVVYIYSAAEILRDVSPDKIRWLQRIQTEGYSTLGLSLTALQNYGDNACNELAIGAPASNVVLLYKCLTQIVVHVRNFEENERPGYVGARRNSTLFEYNSCVEIVYPEKPTSVEANIIVKVTLQHQNATIRNADKDGSMTYNISTVKENKKIFCEVVSIEIHEVGGQEPEIQYQVTASQVDGPVDKEPYDGRRVILSDLSTLTLTDKLWVADCIGGKQTCVPKLTFSVLKSMTDGYVIGSSPTESLSVTLRNVGDPAYTACVRVRVEGVRVRRWSPNCVRESATTAECTPKQPIKNNTYWNTGTIELETESLRSDVRTVSFTADLFERCKARPLSALGRHRETVRLTTNPADLFLQGYSILGDTVYLTDTDIAETGKCIMHSYMVFNRGNATWANIMGEIVVKKEPYFGDWAVTIETRASYKCRDVLNETHYHTICTVTELRKGNKFDVILSLCLQPKTIGSLDRLDDLNLALSSHVTVNFDNNQPKHRLQALLDHTVQRIVLDLGPVTSSSNQGLKMIWKWGLDGSSSQSNYKQKFLDSDLDDSSVVMISIVPLRLVDGSDLIVWENPTPCSTRYCRPVKFTFTTETSDFIKMEKMEMSREIAELVPTPFGDTEIAHELHMTMIDGKVANSIADVASSSTCPICLAKPSDMNNLELIATKPLREDLYQYGISSLHMKIRCMECLLHISYNLDFKRWSARGEHKALKQAKKKCHAARISRTDLLTSLSSNQSAYIRYESVGSNLRAKQAAVPLWVIIAAVIVAIFIVVIIAFVLYECGYLRRKNKEKLNSLKSSVHRQSVRRSMKVQDSMRNSNRIAAAINEKNHDDEEKLIDDKSEEFLLPPPSFVDEASKPNITTTKADITAPKADITAPKADITAPKVETAAPKSDKVPSVMVNKHAPAKMPVADKMAPMCSEKAHTNDELLNDKEELVIDQERIKKQHIILGLQKNIGSRQYPAKPMKPKRHEDVTDEAKL